MSDIEEAPVEQTWSYVGELAELSQPQREILIAARNALRIEGPSAFTMRTIATHSHYSLGGLYRYFPSIDELERILREFLIENSLSIMGDAMVDAIEPEFPVIAALDVLIRRATDDARVSQWIFDGVNWQPFEQRLVAFLNPMLQSPLTDDESRIITQTWFSNMSEACETTVATGDAGDTWARSTAIVEHIRALLGRYEREGEPKGPEPSDG